MTTTFVEKKLLNSIENLLDGYTSRKKDLTLINRSKEVHKLIQLIVIDRGGEWDISPHTYLIHKKLEELYHKAINDKDETVTIGNSFDKIKAFLGGNDSTAPIKPFYYSINEESDFDKVANLIVEEYKIIDAEYFAQFLNISEISQALNHNPEGLSIHYEVNPFRCAKGILAAGMAKNNDINRLIDIYRLRLEIVNQRYKNEFESCVNLALIEFLNHS